MTEAKNQNTKFNSQFSPLGRLGSSIALPISISFWVLAFTRYHPLRAIETHVIIAVVSCLVLFPVLKFLSDRYSLAIQFKIFTGITLYLGSMAFVLFVNARFDNSSEQNFVRPLTGKYIYESKRGPDYYATASSFTPSRLVFLNGWTLDESEGIMVSREVYDGVQSGVYHATWTIKGGGLGIPWVVQTRVFVEATTTSGSATPVDSDYVQGLAYFKGEGQPKDAVKAVEFFRRAADRGLAEAQHDLAYMYSAGAGVKKDDVAAFEWMKKSAEQGYAIAQDDLGVMYGDGRGVAQDWVQAYRWLSQSARQGNTQAKKDLDYAMARMTPEQLAKAKE